jgi:anti-sigma B factor antagonist
MGSNKLDYQVRQEHEVAVIELRGDVNAAAERLLAEAYATATHENPDAVLLDFAGVEYMNSSGIALVVGLMAQARKSGRRLLARGLSEHYQQIFQTTRLSDFMTIV